MSRQFYQQNVIVPNKNIKKELNSLYDDIFRKKIYEQYNLSPKIHSIIISRDKTNYNFSFSFEKFQGFLSDLLDDKILDDRILGFIFSQLSDIISSSNSIYPVMNFEKIVYDKEFNLSFLDFDTKNSTSQLSNSIRKIKIKENREFFEYNMDFIRTGKLLKINFPFTYSIIGTMDISDNINLIKYLKGDFLTIISLKNLVYDHKKEFCYNVLAVRNKIFQLENKTEGYDINQRKACQHKSYTPVILHTHPYNSYSFPSFEDLNKVSKNNQIQTSIIPTLWGIWIISRTSTQVIDVTLSQHIIEALDIFNKNTSIPKNIRKEQKSRDFDQEIRNEIYKLIQFLKKNTLFGKVLDVEFFRWDKIIEEI